MKTHLKILHSCSVFPLCYPCVHPSKHPSRRACSSVLPSQFVSNIHGTQYYSNTNLLFMKQVKWCWNYCGHYVGREKGMQTAKEKKLRLVGIVAAVQKCRSGTVYRNRINGRICWLGISRHCSRDCHEPPCVHAWCHA